MSILLKGDSFKPYSSVAEVLSLSVEEINSLFDRLSDSRKVLLFCALVAENRKAVGAMYDDPACTLKQKIFNLTAPPRAGTYVGYHILMSWSFMVNAHGYTELLDILRRNVGLEAKPVEELRHLKALADWLKEQVVPEEHRLLVGQLIDAFIIQLEEMPFN